METPSNRTALTTAAGPSLTGTTMRTCPPASFGLAARAVLCFARTNLRDALSQPGGNIVWLSQVFRQHRRHALAINVWGQKGCRRVWR